MSESKGIWDGNMLMEYPNLEPPKPEAVKDIWIVSWTSRHGKYHGDQRREAAAFTSEANAKHFKSQIEAAFNFLRFTKEEPVTITKQ